MKTYRIEPTYKKCVCEVELWRKRDDCSSEDYQRSRWLWKGPILRRECWWRWAEWTIEVPETQTEMEEFIKSKGFDTMLEYLDHNCVDTLEQALLPDEDDDSIVLPTDVNCEYCWDGQGEEFRVENTKESNLSEKECREIELEAQRIYIDENEGPDGLEEIGWEHFSTIYEVKCNVRVTLSDDHVDETVNLPSLDSLVIDGAATA